MGQADYAIRYTPDRKEEYAKVKGGKEFKTDFVKNNTGYDVSLGGNKITKEEYDKF
jgi:hypothetical protein